MSADKKVLVIDDAEDHLLICKLVLEHRGYEVLTLPGVESMEQLFESVYSFQPDVIFTDHDMPGINGEDIVRMLKQVPQFSDIPIIYLSGNEKIDQLTEQSGADDFVPKPLKIPEFLSVLTRFTGGDTK